MASWAGGIAGVSINSASNNAIVSGTTVNIVPVVLINSYQALTPVIGGVQTYQTFYTSTDVLPAGTYTIFSELVMGTNTSTQPWVLGEYFQWVIGGTTSSADEITLSANAYSLQTGQGYVYVNMNGIIVLTAPTTLRIRYFHQLTTITNRTVDISSLTYQKIA